MVVWSSARCLRPGSRHGKGHQIHVPTTTRAVTYASAGDPADVLEATEIPDPPPPGPGQIQVEVRRRRSGLSQPRIGGVGWDDSEQYRSNALLRPGRIVTKRSGGQAKPRRSTL